MPRTVDSRPIVWFHVDVTAVDPRPRIVVAPDGAAHVAGVRCQACAEPVAYPWPACPECGGPVVAAEFGPDGVVWSATVVRIPVADRTPPYALAYVDLDDGPRVLAHLDDVAPAVGARVRLRTDTPDPHVEVIG